MTHIKLYIAYIREQRNETTGEYNRFVNLPRLNTYHKGDVVMVQLTPVDLGDAV